MEDRTCPGCRESIAHLTRQYKYCSNACRRWVANGNTAVRKRNARCVVCDSPIVGRMVTAIYCDNACKSRAVEARRVRDDAARYMAERERRIAYATEYARRNPHVGQANKRRRKAAMSGANASRFTSADWIRVQRRFGFRCAYCGESAPLTIDHVVPLIRGGAHSEGNIVPACMACNCRKQGRFIIEWRLGKSRRSLRG